MSHKPLVKPVVSDYAGDLYNKDAIIQFLLPTEATAIDKQEYEAFIQGRIKSLKDVVEVHFEVEHDQANRENKWICPVTSKELGPNVKAVYLVPCGHAFSQEAIKEMKSEGKCVQCAEPYEERDVIPILPSTEKDKAFVVERIETLRALGLTHALKKASGAKKRKAKDESKPERVNGTVRATEQPAKDDSKRLAGEDISRSATPQSGAATIKGANGIKNAATASLTARVLEEEQAKKRVRRENENINSLYTKKGDRTNKNGDFMTRGFSIPANARHQ